jgi:hypothetical protein
VAKSTTEAEYMALSMAVSEAIWIKGLYKELVVDAPVTTTVCCDNTGATDLARNPGYRLKTKHIAVQHHFIRDCIARRGINIEKVASADTVADCLTKGLCKDSHLNCTVQMGLC